MIRVSDLNKVYPKTKALDQVNVNIPYTSITGLVGPNGSGKTTLIQCLLEHIEYDGSIVWKDDDLSMFFIPDENILPDLLTGHEYLNFIEHLYKVSNPKLKERLLESYDMVRDKDKMIQSYSYGMKKKIQLIGAFMIAPNILILDEIFRGLDIEAILTTKKELLNYTQEGGSVLLSSHDILAVEQLSQHIILLVKGKVLAQGSVSSLCSLHNKKTLEEVFIHLNV